MKIKKILTLVISSCLLFTGGLTGISPTDNVSAASDKSRVSVHDPSIIKDSGTYYVFGSHIDAAKSTDLQNWNRFTNGYSATNNVEFGNLSQNLAKAFAWAGEDLEDCEGGFSVWAPDVIWNPDYINTDGTKGAYLMYFCTSSTYMCSVIGFATAKNIEGPYTFVDTLIYSGFTENDSYATSSTKNVNRKYTSTNIDELIASGEVTYNSDWFSNNNFNNYLYPNAIDPTIYYDTDGTMYMVYGSWSGGIFTLEIDPSTGRCIHPETGTTSDGRMIDSYFGTKIAGGYYKSGEGPFIEYNPDNGYYYLWTTYGGLLSEGGYNMRVSRSTSPTGPFYDAAGNPAVLSANTNLDSVGLKIMGNYKFSSLNTAYMACGHNSVLRDDDGQWYLFYHARFNDGSEYHEVRVHTMYFNDEGWPVVSPFEYSGDKMAEYGYEPADIAGDYEYINHGNSTDEKIINYSNITLNEDGSISGAVTGSWSQSKDSSTAVITIGNQRYNGYFLAAQDENGKKVMTFTAVGSNNQTVWGAKTTAFNGTERSGNIDYTGNRKLVYAPDTAVGAGVTVKIGDTDLLSGVSYYISNKNSGLLLDLDNGITESGTNIQQWSDTDSSAQEWRIISEDNGYCRIVSLADESKCMAVSDNSADNGVNIELQEYNGADNQLWKLVKDGSYYGIVSKCSDSTAGLDVYDWSTENGGNINQWEYWGGDCQLWSITPVYPYVPSGNYTFRNAESGQLFGDVWTCTALENGGYSVQSADKSTSCKVTIIANKNGSYTLLPNDNDVFGSENSYVIEPASAEKKSVVGDVNADGIFNVADLVMMQNFILGSGTLNDWQAGNLCEDDRIDVSDMILMRQLIIK
ncbi:MAG: family 43 glycosylhydrolase [Ruminococcus flavefaciens]|nr:family 43 glycosylhydrolase [Ruminococcus flavefaciens]MCM1230591.1 family 43 glycosylhydrolase [Ruminococcus flavefaciens]